MNECANTGLTAHILVVKSDIKPLIVSHPPSGLNSNYLLSVPLRKSTVLHKMSVFHLPVHQEIPYILNDKDKDKDEIFQKKKSH